MTLHTILLKIALTGSMVWLILIFVVICYGFIQVMDVCSL